VSTDRTQVIAELFREMPRMVQETVRFYTAVGDQLDMHLTDMNCLGALGYAGPLSAGELASSLGLTTGAVTRVIDRLEARGLVRRLPDPRDRRRVVVEPVPEALGPINEAFAGMGGHFDAATIAMSDEELRFLLDFVRRSADFAHDEANRLRSAGVPHATRKPTARRKGLTDAPDSRQQSG
jgi:DNA-binding MarR family transcriptional regulator